MPDLCLHHYTAVLVQSLNVIILLSFKKIKSKGFMVYYNALICLYKSLPKFLLGNYLKYVDLVVARPDISKHISIDNFYL